MNVSTQQNPTRHDPGKTDDPNKTPKPGDDPKDKDKDKDKEKDGDDSGKNDPGRSTQSSGPGSVTGSGTNNNASVKDPRGSGSGEQANAARRWTPRPLPTKPHEVHVKELVDLAEQNEEYNNDVNKAQIATAESDQKIISKAMSGAIPPDPKKEREEVLQQYKDDNDPAKKKQRLQGEIDARKKRDEAKADRMYATTK